MCFFSLLGQPLPVFGYPNCGNFFFNTVTSLDATLLLLVCFPYFPRSAAWLVLFFMHLQLPVPVDSLKLWVAMSSPRLLELAFAHLFWGNPSLRPYLCATDRRWQTRNKKLFSGEALVCSCSSLPWASAGLSCWGSHLPLLPCAVLPHPQDGDQVCRAV